MMTSAKVIKEDLESTTGQQDKYWKTSQSTSTRVCYVKSLRRGTKTKAQPDRQVVQKVHGELTGKMLTFFTICKQQKEHTCSNVHVAQ